MGFDFNPSLWFVCRLCRRSFTSTETLKEHKLACHLGECMGIKCIVFEERLLTEEWTAGHNLTENQNQTLNANLVNKSLLNECEEKIQLDNTSVNKVQAPFKNPVVSLTRIKEQKKNSCLNRSSSSYVCPGQETCSTKEFPQGSSSFKLTAAEKKSKLSQQELPKPNEMDNASVSKATHNNFIGSQNSLAENNINVLQDDIQVKVESSGDELQITPANSLSVADEGAYTNLQQGFIVPSFSSYSVPVPQVQFAWIPVAARQYQLLPQQQQPLTIFNAPILPEPEDQAMTPDNENETNDFNSNRVDVEIKIDTYDSNLIGSNSELLENQNQILSIQEQESQTDGLYQQGKPSISLVNIQSITSADKEVATPFMCETCFAIFRSNEILKRHMICHSSIKPFKCTECPLEFKRSYELTRHQVVHGKETKFKCRFCDKYFSREYKLQVHERSHTGDKPFKCPVANCDYAAASSDNLKSHTRVNHGEELGLQQFVCPTCGKTYGLKSRLERHIKACHSGSTPFYCTHEGCTMQFKLKQSLQRHVIKVHS